jgi:hypothetical protein
MSSVGLPVQERGWGVLPFRYLAGFIEFLARNRDRINVVTYDDLAWGDDYDHLGSYPDEWINWKAQHADSDKIHVLVQHDVDAVPAATNEIVQVELDQGVPANVMVFARLHNRSKLARRGAVVFEPYPIDIDLLKRAQRDNRFVVGYHSCCVEQVKWDLDAAVELFQADLQRLRENFDVRYFSPHGGIPGPQDQNNFDVPLTEEHIRSARWVHNRFSPSWSGSFSDGALITVRGRSRLDLRDVVRTWTPGHRYRVLTHPQYYAQDVVRHPAMESAEWVQELHLAYERGERDFWRDVTLGPD